MKVIVGKDFHLSGGLADVPPGGNSSDGTDRIPFSLPSGYDACLIAKQDLSMTVHPFVKLQGQITTRTLLELGGNDFVIIPIKSADYIRVKIIE